MHARKFQRRLHQLVLLQYFCYAVDGSRSQRHTAMTKNTTEVQNQLRHSYRYAVVFFLPLFTLPFSLVLFADVSAFVVAASCLPSIAKLGDLQ